LGLHRIRAPDYKVPAISQGIHKEKIQKGTAARAIADISPHPNDRRGRRVARSRLCSRVPAREAGLKSAIPATRVLATPKPSARFDPRKVFWLRHSC